MNEKEQTLSKIVRPLVTWHISEIFRSSKTFITWSFKKNKMNHQDEVEIKQVSRAHAFLPTGQKIFYKTNRNIFKVVDAWLWRWLDQLWKVKRTICMQLLEQSNISNLTFRFLCMEMENQLITLKSFQLRSFLWWSWSFENRIVRDGFCGQGLIRIEFQRLSFQDFVFLNNLKKTKSIKANLNSKMKIQNWKNWNKTIQSSQNEKK